MSDVYERVAAWNAARYDQVFDKDLAIKPLREEYMEYLESETDVDRLDALCDLTYIALGTLWKLDAPLATQNNCNEEARALANKFIDLGEIDLAFFIGTFLDVYEYASYPVTQTVFNILAFCSSQMLGMGIDSIEAMLIVCDSNDSKVAKKTDSTVKANIDKGSSFIAPEPRLQALLDNARA